MYSAFLFELKNTNSAEIRRALYTRRRRAASSAEARSVASRLLNRCRYESALVGEVVVAIPPSVRATYAVYGTRQGEVIHTTVFR